MENSEIHNGLDKKIIRDYISISFCELFDLQKEIKRQTPPTELIQQNVYEYEVKRIEADIKELKAHLQIANKKFVLYELMKMNGWSEYDISDETQKDLSYTLYMNFIGTEEEHSTLLAQIKTHKTCKREIKD
jgi:hypothetical protein